MKNNSSGRGMLLYAGNVRHSAFSALGMHDAGVLRRFLGPVLISGKIAGLLPAAYKNKTESRVISRPPDLRYAPLLLGELSRRLPIDDDRAVGISTWMYGQQVKLSSARRDIGAVQAMSGLALEAFASRSRTFRVLECRALHTNFFAKAANEFFPEVPGSAATNEVYAERFLQEYDHADHIITYSTVAASSFLDRGWPRDRVSVIPLGVDPTVFTPGKTVARKQALELLFVGRLDRWKGAHLIGSALQGIKNIRLTLVGQAHPETISWLRKRIDEVVVTGPAPLAVVRDRMRRSDLLLLPSAESFGLVALEAQACGTPVLLSSLTGATECCVNGVTSFVVDPRDIGGMNALVSKLADDPGIARGMRKACRANAERWSWDAHVRAVSNLWSLLAAA